MSYTHLYVLITTYSWDETFENDDNLNKYRLKRKEKNESREEIFYQMKGFFC